MLRPPRRNLWFWRGNCLNSAALCCIEPALSGDLGSRSIDFPTYASAIPQTARRSCPGVQMSNPLAQQDRSGTAPTDASRDPFTFPARSRPASGSSSSTTNGRCGRAAPACCRWTATTSRWWAGARRRWTRSSAGSSTSSWSTCTCRRCSGLDILRAALAGQQGHHRRRHDGQPQRHQQHRGAAGRRLGLPAEAVLAPPISRC